MDDRKEKWTWCWHVTSWRYRRSETRALDSPDKYEVWELAANGARLRRIESSVADGRLRFTAAVSGPDGARMLYEIFQEQKK